MNTELTQVTELTDEAAGVLVNAMQVKFKKLDKRAVLPAYAKYGDAGLDLSALEISEETETYIEYRTGLAVEIPWGYVGLLFPRSSVSKFDLILANSIGVVDSGYRGEILLRFKKVASYNKLLRALKLISQYLSGYSNKTHVEIQEAKLFDLSKPIAQLMVLPYPQIAPVWADELSDTERGGGNFGHTTAGAIAAPLATAAATLGRIGKSYKA